MKKYMNIIEKIKYELWPYLKTRGYFWWWVIKYGGKKKIPPEVIFSQMAKSIERLNQNLHCARSAMMDDASKEEMGEIYDVIKKVEEMESGVDKMFRK